MQFLAKSVNRMKTRKASLTSASRYVKIGALGLSAGLLLGISMAHAQEAEPAPQVETAQSTNSSAGNSEGESASGTWSQAPFANFIDTRTRQTAPDPKLIEKGLRILTSDGFAPFNSVGEDGRPQGYHVDLAKLMCEDLNMACTIKVVDFSAIPDLLKQGKADIALAGLTNHPSIRDQIGFSLSYLQRPARFVARQGESLRISPSGLAGKPVAVVGRSAHEAYLKAYFPDAKPIAVADLADAQKLLVDDKVVAIFADAMHLSKLIAQSDGGIGFRAEPYLDQHFFGQGMAIAYQRRQQDLRGLLDYALVRLAKKGNLAELYARYFPLDIYAHY